jgi:hypothetical protein
MGNSAFKSRFRMYAQVDRKYSDIAGLPQGWLRVVLETDRVKAVLQVQHATHHADSSLTIPHPKALELGALTLGSSLVDVLAHCLYLHTKKLKSGISLEWR